jgi:ABC-type antimicrobial peptide transport system permease subunit
MFQSVEKFEYVNFQLGSIFFTIIFFLFLIDGILIYSMMLSDVEERTYEFAMLRCLGFKNSSLVTLLLVQACF